MEVVLKGVKLDEAELRPALDRIWKALTGKPAAIEIAATAAAPLPLLGVTFDRYYDMIEVAIEGFDHMIRKPREVYLDQMDEMLAAIEFVDAADIVVKLKDPVVLPAGRLGRGT
jgi:hypothetical protein